MVCINDRARCRFHHVRDLAKNPNDSSELKFSRPGTSLSVFKQAAEEKNWLDLGATRACICIYFAVNVVDQAPNPNSLLASRSMYSVIFSSK
jgi:hypothetical protein